jgi:hypothetical protein
LRASSPSVDIEIRNTIVEAAAPKQLAAIIALPRYGSVQP